jgi:hypothetical protein
MADSGLRVRNVNRSWLLLEALNMVGRSIWADNEREKFAECWRAVEAIARGDSSVKWATPPLVLSTIQRRSTSSLDTKDFSKMKSIRNLVAHTSPSNEQSREVRFAASKMCRLSFEVVDSLLRETIHASQPNEQ